LFSETKKKKDIISTIPLYGAKLFDFSKQNCFKVESQVGSSSSLVFRHDNPQVLFEWSTAILKHKIVAEEVITFMLSLEPTC